MYGLPGRSMRTKCAGLEKTQAAVKGNANRSRIQADRAIIFCEIDRGFEQHGADALPAIFRTYQQHPKPAKIVSIDDRCDCADHGARP